MKKGDILQIGSPIALLLISVITFIFVSIEIKKRRLELKSIIGWFIINTIYTIIMLYILIDAILQYEGINNSVNIFTWFAREALGIKMGSQEWIFILIFAFISFVLVITMINSIKVERINRRVDELNREVAILRGKVNKTVNFTASEIAVNPKALSEIKRELKHEFKIAKAKKKQKQKLRQLETVQISNIDSIRETKETKIKKDK